VAYCWCDWATAIETSLKISSSWKLRKICWILLSFFWFGSVGAPTIGFLWIVISQIMCRDCNRKKCPERHVPSEYLRNYIKKKRLNIFEQNQNYFTASLLNHNLKKSHENISSDLAKIRGWMNSRKTHFYFCPERIRQLFKDILKTKNREKLRLLHKIELGKSDKWNQLSKLKSFCFPFFFNFKSMQTSRATIWKCPYTF